MLNWRRFLPLVQRVVTTALALFVLYLLVGGIFIFLIHTPGGRSRQEIDASHFFGNGTGVDKALVVEERMNSAVARINLIEAAHSSINLAYYAVHDGLSSDLFYAALLEAADRGVTIRLLFDGMFHNLKGRGKATLHVLLSHPNVSVRFYEPANLLLPWTLNNRLHDKTLIVDDTYALIGGRNIGDKYFLEPYGGKAVQDRDVLIINTTRTLESASVLSSFSHYYNRLWESPYTKQKKTYVRNHDIDVERQRLLNRLGTVRSQYPTHFPDPIDWQAWAVATSKISLVTNPITRLNKEPVVLLSLSALAAQARESVVIQGPYIIVNTPMRRDLTLFEADVKSTAITNSRVSSPNLFALCGYLKRRPSLIEAFDEVYEYHGVGSIHAKSYLADDRFSAIGSFNLDPRSAYLSCESIVVIDSPSLARSLRTHMEAIITQSTIATRGKAEQKGPWYKALIVSILNVVLYPFSAFL